MTDMIIPAPAPIDADRQPTVTNLLEEVRDDVRALRAAAQGCVTCVAQPGLAEVADRLGAILGVADAVAETASKTYPDSGAVKSIEVRALREQIKALIAELESRRV